MPSLPTAAANLPPLSWRWRGSGRSTWRWRLTLSQSLSLGRGHGVPPSALGGFRIIRRVSGIRGFQFWGWIFTRIGVRGGFRFWVRVSVLGAQTLHPIRTRPVDILNPMCLRAYPVQRDPALCGVWGRVSVASLTLACAHQLL